jgi:hypothetical protein
MCVFLSFQARFLPGQCAAGIFLSDGNTVATKTSKDSFNTNVVLHRPAFDEQRDLTVTWCRKGANMYVGWAMRDLDPNTRDAYRTHGSFIDFLDGKLTGLGTTVVERLPNGGIPEGGTLSLRYNPARGTMHARVNDGDEVFCFIGLRNDLVPAINIVFKGDSCTIVVCLFENISSIFLFFCTYVCKSVTQ